MTADHIAVNRMVVKMSVPTPNKIFPVYEVGSLPKLGARVKALRGEPVTKENLHEFLFFARKAGVESEPIIRNTKKILRNFRVPSKKPTDYERGQIISANALINLGLQKNSGLDFFYDGEARRNEMYSHVAQCIKGFEPLPEMIRSRAADSWRCAVCVSEPQLNTWALRKLVLTEFEFNHIFTGGSCLKVPINDPYMMAVMSDNRHYLSTISSLFSSSLSSRSPTEIRYEAKRQLTLALAKNVVRPQVEALISTGAKWIQLDAPAATLDLGHLPIFVEGINAVVAGLAGVKFSIHLCYPRRVSLTDKRGYELLFPHILKLDPQVNHLSLELANADSYATDLAPLVPKHAGRRFEIGLGVLDVTAERERNKKIETPELVRDRILLATEILDDANLVWPAPDCGLRQLSLERAVKLYEILVEGAKMARKVI